MKKIIFTIVLVFLLLAGGVAYYFYINSGAQTVDPGKIFTSVKNFFPFGTPNPTTTPPTNQNTSTSTQPNQNNRIVKVERMFQISEAPVAGFTATDTMSTTTELFFNKEKNATTSSSTKKTDTSVFFLDRATGHLLKYKIGTSERTKISNSTIPKVYEAFINPKGNEFITRTLSGDSINTEDVQISSGTSTASTSRSIYFPSNTDIFIAKGNSVFYTTKTPSGSTGFISTFDNKKPIQVFSTPLRDISAMWSGGDIVEVFSKPHSEYNGILFSVDTKKQTIKQTLSDIPGLTASPNIDGSYILFNSNIKNLSLASKKLSSGSQTFLNLKTLPEKCVWSKKYPKTAYCAVPNYTNASGYPEKWYQGIISFTDDFWKVDVETGEQTLIYRPLDEGKPMPDAINLSLNDKENYLLFINKKDLSLWGLSI